MTPPFPFSAIVGQEAMKLALRLVAVDPTLGGVLVFGDRGAGKSTAVRALASLLPPLAMVADCPYGCAPAGTAGSGGTAKPATWAGSEALGREACGDGASGTEARIRAVIASRVNPLVACPGGEVELVGLRDDGVTEVVMRGGCQGCAAAAGTLADVVSRILMRAVPGLASVHDVTAHEEGTAPYFARG